MAGCGGTAPSSGSCAPASARCAPASQLLADEHLSPELRQRFRPGWTTWIEKRIAHAARTADRAAQGGRTRKPARRWRPAEPRRAASRISCARAFGSLDVAQRDLAAGCARSDARTSRLRRALRPPLDLLAEADPPRRRGAAGAAVGGEASPRSHSSAAACRPHLLRIR